MRLATGVTPSGANQPSDVVTQIRRKKHEEGSNHQMWAHVFTSEGELNELNHLALSYHRTYPPSPALP